MKIKTISEFAKERQITTMGVRQLKSINIEDLPLYVKISDNNFVPLIDLKGKQQYRKFVIEK